MNSQRNNPLELFKLFASYMVVFIHIKFWGDLGIIMDVLARVAVPLFFLISGFYSYHLPPPKIKKRIRKTVNLSLFAFISYTLYNIVIMLLQGNIHKIVLYFKAFLDFDTLKKLFIFNVPIHTEHLWYMLAILYVYVVFYLMTVHRFNEKIIFAISFSLLFFQLLLGECHTAFGIVLPTAYLRNFLLIGIPFFGLGLFAKKHEEKLYLIPNYMLIITSIVGAMVSILSVYLFGSKDVYLGSVFILFAIVATFVKYSKVKYPSFFNALAGCSTYIYIFHIMMAYEIYNLFALFSIDLNSSRMLKNLFPIMVCIVSTVLAVLISKLLNKFKQIKAKSKQNG